MMASPPLSCTCGHHVQSDGIILKENHIMMETSFVQVPLENDEEGLSQTLSRLQQNVERTTTRLCSLCLKRLQYSLTMETGRLFAEAQAYKTAIQDDKMRIKQFCKLRPVDTLVPSYRTEIEQLKASIAEHRAELKNLRDIQRQQLLMETELNIYNNEMADAQNALVLQARAFCNEQEQLTSILSLLHEEEEQLAAVDIRLIDLQVDERGLRYPTFNGLRLAYYPKGDVTWEELQASWALAVQLLLFSGNIFEFSSQSWKLIPLSKCAKLIYYPNKSSSTVFHLGHPKTKTNKSILTWNALLCQVIQHVQARLDAAVRIGMIDGTELSDVPFQISPTKIGSMALTTLDEGDDVAWSHVIHYMASNLLWLSNVTAQYLRQQVVLTTPLVPAELRDESSETIEQPEKQASSSL